VFPTNCLVRSLHHRTCFLLRPPYPALSTTASACYCACPTPLLPPLDVAPISCHGWPSRPLYLWPSHPLLIMLVHVTSLQGTLLIKVEFYVDFERKMSSYYGLQSITSVASVLVKGRAWLLIFLILFRVD
jgi:hypothetical protein